MLSQENMACDNVRLMYSIKNKKSLLGPYVPAHACSQSSLLSKLFSFPPQPPYLNCSHFFVFELKYHLLIDASE